MDTTGGRPFGPRMAAGPWPATGCVFQDRAGFGAREKGVALSPLAEGFWMLGLWLNSGALPDQPQEKTMSVARVTELSATSTKSFEDAVATGISRATKTLRGVSGAWVKEHKVAVKNDKIVSWQVNMMVTFVLED
jgi:dodecin